MGKPVVCIAGKNDIAIECLKWLIDNYSYQLSDVVACVNASDTGVDGVFNSYKKYCIENNVDIVSIKSLLGDPRLYFFSLQFDKLIDPLEFSSDKLFNVHFSFLPEYKGMYTSVLPILHGKTYSGVTLHEIDRGIDTGDIVDQIKIDIDFDDTSKDLYLKYIDYGIRLFKKNFKKIINNEFSTKKQSSTGASYYSKKSINFSKLKIDIRKTAFEIHNSIRAFYFSGMQKPMILGVPVIGSQIKESVSREKGVGAILLDTEEYFDISTIDYDIRLYKG